MKDYSSLIDKNKVPKHVAIIMDGNRRWAEKRSLPRLEGHKRGAEIIESITESAYSLGVEVLSLYTFSLENWSRPKAEIEGLWKLMDFYLRSRKDSLHSKGVKIRFCGFHDRLPKKLLNSILELTESTKKNSNITLNMCFNYGGRQDIVNGVNEWLMHRKRDEKFSEKKMDKFLLTAGLPDVDLMIRTSGEYRISNFLIWQLAYTEFVFIDVLWPDFKSRHLARAIYEYQNRERRYGGW
jgi:undecaprenyl diphosphate synthase